MQLSVETVHVHRWHLLLLTHLSFWSRDLFGERKVRSSREGLEGVATRSSIPRGLSSCYRLVFP